MYAVLNSLTSTQIMNLTRSFPARWIKTHELRKNVNPLANKKIKKTLHTHQWVSNKLVLTN